jgi:hypothetical protein
MGVIQQQTLINHKKLLLVLHGPQVKRIMNFRNVHDYAPVHTAYRPRGRDSSVAALLIAYCYCIRFSAIADYKYLPLLSQLLRLCISEDVFFLNSPH